MKNKTYKEKKSIYKQEFLNRLQELMKLDGDVVKDIRIMLQFIANKVNTYWGCVHTCANVSLIVLAKAYPINKEDFYYEPIPKHKKIVTSDGYQFDIEQLTNWMEMDRNWRNPYTNKKFGFFDQRIIGDKSNSYRRQVATAENSEEKFTQSLIP